MVAEAAKAGAEIGGKILDALGDLVVKGIEKLGELARGVAETADGLIKSFGSAISQVNALFSNMAEHAISEINRILEGLVHLELQSDRIRI